MMKVKNKTAIKKIIACIESLEDLHSYLRSKGHDQTILSCSDVYRMNSQLYDALKDYKKLEKP